jgi:hypothetical protein
MPSNGVAPPVDIKPFELLRYLPTYRVVVCGTCQYAVQPKAIARHLKDIHHIHRGRRRPFMKYVSELRLDEVEEGLYSGCLSSHLSLF